MYGFESSALTALTVNIAQTSAHYFWMSLRCNDNFNSAPSESSEMKCNLSCSNLKIIRLNFYSRNSVDEDFSRLNLRVVYT